MRNVYVCEQNCKIHKNGDYLTVRKENGKISDISLNGVQSIILFGNVQITTQAIGLIMEKGADILMESAGGRLKGRVSSEYGKNVLMRIAQYDAWFEKAKRLHIAKCIVGKKLANQREVIRSYRYRRRLPELKKAEGCIDEIAQKARSAESTAELMGWEGRSAAVYFQSFARLFEDGMFVMRARRPAYDPVNALLNLTYTFLKNEVTTILQAYSFDTQLGFLHQIRSGRDSLALDWMEPFRPTFADRFVVRLISKKILSEKDFECSEEGMRLKKESLREYCALFQEEMNESTGGSAQSCRQKIEDEISGFRKILLERKVDDL